jgi:hypothetical protein
MPAAVAWQFWERVLSGAAIGSPRYAIFAFVAASLALDVVVARGGEDAVLHAWPRWARAAVLAVAILAWFLATRGSTPPPFVYQGF